MIRELAGEPALKAICGREESPGADVQTDAEIDAWIRRAAETIYHPVGTCRMGRAGDPMAVVDGSLKVQALAGLRVIDASVMPTLVGGNTNAPTIMIAEKAADMILGRAALPPARRAGVRGPGRRRGGLRDPAWVRLGQENKDPKQSLAADEDRTRRAARMLRHRAPQALRSCRRASHPQAIRTASARRG